MVILGTSFRNDQFGNAILGEIIFRMVILGDVSLEWPFWGRHFGGRHFRVAMFELGDAISDISATRAHGDAAPLVHTNPIVRCAVLSTCVLVGGATRSCSALRGARCS